MRFAEVFLRLGSSLVAWMMIYTYVVWLAALPAMGCGPDGDEMHLLLLWLAPISSIFAFVLRVTREFPDIHRMLSWLGVPIALLLIVALPNVWSVFMRTNSNGMSICSAGRPESWQLFWAPIQFAALLAITAFIINVWRNSRLKPPGGSATTDRAGKQ